MAVWRIANGRVCLLASGEYPLDCGDLVCQFGGDDVDLAATADHAKGHGPAGVGSRHVVRLQVGRLAHQGQFDRARLSDQPR